MKNIYQYVAYLLYCMAYVMVVDSVLDDYYYHVTSPLIAYEKSFSWLRLCLCLPILMLIFYKFIVNGTRDFFKKCFLWFSFIIYFTPLVLSFALFDHKYSNEFFCASIIFMACFVCFISKLNINVLKIDFDSIIPFEKKKWNDELFILIAIVITITLINSINGFSFSYNLLDVYEIRKNFSSEGNIFLTIIKSALGGVVFPAAIVKYFEEKKYIYGCTFIGLQLCMFSLAKDKTYFFMIFVCLILVAFKTIIYKDGERLFLIGLLGLSALNIISMLNIYTNVFFNIVVRRLSIIPTWISYLYFEFFFDHKKLMWMQETVLINHFFYPPYEMSLREIISYEYFQGVVGNPNNGMVGIAFANFGWLGLVVFPILISILINIYKEAFKNGTRLVQIIVALAVSQIYINDSFTSTAYVYSFLCVMVFSRFFNTRDGN